MNAHDAFTNHTVDRVASSTADSDYFYGRLIFKQIFRSHCFPDFAVQAIYTRQSLAANKDGGE
ncbi:MAG: hypothetical protein WCG75_10450, partial [Armatimonadota bacterium]